MINQVSCYIVFSDLTEYTETVFQLQHPEALEDTATPFILACRKTNVNIGVTPIEQETNLKLKLACSEVANILRKARN